MKLTKTTFRRYLNETDGIKDRLQIGEKPIRQRDELRRYGDHLYRDYKEALMVYTRYGCKTAEYYQRR